MPTLAFLDDASFASIFNSPFIVPVFGTIMILGIVVSRIWSGVRIREMQSQERLAAIAKGIPIPPAYDRAPPRPGSHASAFPAGDIFAPTPRRAKDRRAGIILVSIGFGMVAFFIFLSAILHVREVLIPAAAGLFPLAIGIGLLIDARIRSSELSRLDGMGNPQHNQEPWHTAPAPPTPSAAAASDWNPLH